MYICTYVYMNIPLLICLKSTTMISPSTIFWLRCERSWRRWRGTLLRPRTSGGDPGSLGSSAERSGWMMDEYYAFIGGNIDG